MGETKVERLEWSSPDRFGARWREPITIRGSQIEHNKSLTGEFSYVFRGKNAFAFALIASVRRGSHSDANRWPLSRLRLLRQRDRDLEATTMIHTQEDRWSWLAEVAS